MKRAAGLESATSAVTDSWTAAGTAGAWKFVVEHALVWRAMHHGSPSSTTQRRDTNWRLSVATTLVQTYSVRYEEWTIVKQVCIPFGSIATTYDKLFTGAAEAR